MVATLSTSMVVATVALGAAIVVVAVAATAVVVLNIDGNRYDSDVDKGVKEVAVSAEGEQ